MPRPCNPCFLHYGDALAVYARNPQQVEGYLDRIAAAGYHGVRTWTVLATVRGDYWAGRDVGPWMPNYPDLLGAFQDALRTRGLLWLVSQGDLWHLDRAGREETQAALLHALDRIAVAGMDTANEPENNHGGSPDDMRRWLQPFIDAWPGLVWSLGSPVNEDRAALATYAGNVFDVHGYRGGRWWDKVRHIFSLTYQGEAGPSPRRLGIQSENCGPGPFVSVTENKHELTGDVMATMGVMSTLARQWWVYFPGFEKDTGDVAQAGFLETPKAIALLPHDVMTYQHLVHGGQSQSRRVFEVTNESRTLRCDHAIHDDGRYVCLAYGPDLGNHRQVRGRVGQTVPIGDKAILYLGVA